MSETKPCVYPGCRDISGNPQITSITICDSSRRHYRRNLDQLLLGYVQLRDELPRNQGRGLDEDPIKTPHREYGHPAEWASDLSRLIADLLGEAHDGLAEYLHHDPPPHPGNREPGRVVVSFRYLTNWFDDLCTYPAAEDTAVSLYELSGQVRHGLGKSNRAKRLHIPCPECELLTLVRKLDRAGTDEVDCVNCGYHIAKEHYGLWARIIMDELLQATI